MLQTSPHQLFVPHAYNRNDNIRNKRILNNSETLPSLKLSERRIDNSSLTNNSKDNNIKLSERNLCKLSQIGQNEESWPQIQSIVKKIKVLELALRQQQQTNKELLLRISQYEQSIQQSQRQQGKQAGKMENYSKLENRILQLQNAILQKDNALTAKEQNITDMQFKHIKKNQETQEKIGRLSIENKDLMEKVKWAKNELQRERDAFKLVKQELNAKINKMKEQQWKQIEQCAQTLNRERQGKLYEQMQLLTRKAYTQEQQLQRKSIQLSLLQRKKQQAISEVAQKKDQQIKVTKSLIRSLNDKIGKLQEELKSKRSKTPEVYTSRQRMSRSLILSTVHEQEITLDLSPDKP